MAFHLLSAITPLSLSCQCLSSGHCHAYGNPLSECMCEEYRVNVSSPRPYVIMKLWAFCLSFVWQYPSHILSLLYIDISIAKFLYSKHLCVFAWAQAHHHENFWFSWSSLAFNLLQRKTKHSHPQSHIQEQTFVNPPLTIIVTPPLLQYSKVSVPTSAEC